jgi:type I restriction enzyme M protein
MTQTVTNSKKHIEMSFEEKLWETAEQLRGKVEVSNYKYIAVGLMFLKFISERYNFRRNELDNETRDPKSDNYCKTEKDRAYLLTLKDQYTSKGVFYLRKGDRWIDLTKIVSSEPNLAIKIDEMLIDIEKDNPPLENVLPKIFSGSNLPNDNLKELIELFDSIIIEKDEEIAKDSFGRIYEFFMKKFSKRELSRGGEFFTPESIVRLLVEILEPYQGILYDPTCGSGGMFVQSYKFLQAHKKELEKRKKKTGLSVYGIESQTGIWRICKMNLAIRGIESKNIKNDDCLIGNPFSNLKANRIMANPPFNLREWGYEKLKGDKQFSKYGLPSNSKPGGNFAFMEHMIYHMDERNGRLGLVLANGSMSVGGQEGKIREAIVRDDLVDCIVALPTNLFYTVVISACLWFLTKNKDDGETRKRKGETLFIDARRIFTKVDRVLNEFSIEQIEKIAGTYRSFIGEESYPKYKDISGYCKVVTINDIEKNKFVLTPGRYVGSEENVEDDESFEEKMNRLTKEYAKLSDESRKLDIQIRRNLKEMSFEI